MKIAIITPHIFNPSGIGSMCNNLTSELIRIGNKVSIFAFEVPEQYMLNKVDKNAKIYIIKQTNWILDKYYHVLTLFWIFKTMGTNLFSVDLIYIHGYTDLTKAGFFLGKIFRKPIILHFHGTDVWYYRKSFFGLYKKIVRNVDKVICVSKCLRDKLLKDTGVRSEVIPNMVSDFFISQRGKSSNFLKEKFNTDKILLNVKGLIPIYGHDLLIRSLPDVLKKYPNLKLVLTGEGPLLEKLKQLVVTLCIENNVVFAGFRGHEELVDFYASSDIHVLSSKLESRANVVMESLLCGTPVITTSNPAGIELANQYHGDVTLIGKDTPVVLANAIIKILDEGRRVKESTIAKISNELNTRVITQKFCDIYRNIADRETKKYGM